MDAGIVHMSRRPGRPRPRDASPVMRREDKTPAELLAHNDKLSLRLAGMLPPGMDVLAAARGFKNLGQFVAAVHVAHNLGIHFTALKDKMLGPPGMSLGSALHALRPQADEKATLRQAQRQARRDLRRKTQIW